MGHITLDINPRRTGQMAGGQAIPIVIFQKQFQNASPGIHYPLGIGLNNHPFFHRGGTGSHQFFFPFHFNHADPAGLLRFQQGMMAQGRDENPFLGRCL